MKVGIMDAEALFAKRHRFPNLASMKISGYMKRRGHDVSLVVDPEADISGYDKVYLSKVFTITEVSDRVLESPNVVKGGTGFFTIKHRRYQAKLSTVLPITICMMNG